MGGQKVVGKIIVKGDIRLVSPFVIGAGKENENVDIEVIKDGDGTPYIPATSLIGAMRHYFDTKAMVGDRYKKEDIDYFWGIHKSDLNDSGYQSALYLRDLYPKGDVSIRIRDGIKMDAMTGMAEDGKKYDYEIVEPGAVFSFYSEVNLREAYSQDTFMEIMAFMIRAMENGGVRIGGRTTRGFGKCKMINAEVHHLDFKIEEHIIRWLMGDAKGLKKKDISLLSTIPKRAGDFRVEGTFNIKTSILIGSYSNRILAPDIVHISSDGTPVLPGTSLAGTLRNRAEMIVNTLNPDRGHIVRDLFGWWDDGENGGKSKSRIIVEETPITNVVEGIQNRIAIDRFTGGTRYAALFNEAALWPQKGKDSMIKVNFLIEDCKPYEAGLMLLVIKDLWSADLALGGGKNIGRGVLTGQSLGIFYDGADYSIKEEDGKLKIGGPLGKLEDCVGAFVMECRKGVGEVG